MLNPKFLKVVLNYQMHPLSAQERWSLLALSGGCIAILYNAFLSGGEPLIASLAFAGLAFAFTFYLIRQLGDVFMAVGRKGRDMSKLNKPEMYVHNPYILGSWRLMRIVRSQWVRYAQWFIF